MDPHLAGDTTSAGVVVEVFSGLVAFDTELRIIPDIAESFDIQGGVVYTFRLRPDVRFHNGKPVTTADFKWSMERAADPTTASPLAGTYLGDILGFDEFAAGETDEIEGIQVLDARTLQITIDAPKAYFLAKLTYHTAYVLDRETVESGGRNWWMRDPVGTGPFKLTDYRPGERIILERNEDYYREPAKVQKVDMNLAGGLTLSMYVNDEIDIANVSLFTLEQGLEPDSPLHDQLVVAPPGFSTSYIGFNATVPPFDDVKFRKALVHAVDKPLINTEIYSDQLTTAYGILPPGFPGFNPQLRGLEFDPLFAQQLLSESRYADPEQRPAILVSEPGTGGPINPATAVIIQMWKEVLGVDVDVQQVSWQTFLQDLNRQRLQVTASLGWAADYPDPHNFLDILFHSESGLNHGAYADPDLDAVLLQARVEVDPDARLALYHQAEQMIVDAAFWLPLWFPAEENVLIKPYVTGYALTPTTVPKLKYVDIEPQQEDE